MFLIALSFQITFPMETIADAGSNRARLMWSAFACATFADMYGDKDEFQRLSGLGYEAGRAFLEDLQNKTATEKEIAEAPIGVRMRMGGPSHDFIVGRIFEASMDDAFDFIVKTDGNGWRIEDATRWADDELKITKAEHEYSRRNCALMR